MRSVRLLLLAAVFPLLGAASCTRAAANAAGDWVEVSPTSVPAGLHVSISAGCGDAGRSAVAASRSFGTVALRPMSNVLSAEAQVPASTSPGTYDVTLTCADGSRATTTHTVAPSAVAQVAAVRTQSSASPAPPPPVGTVGSHTGGGFLATGGTGTGGLLHWITGRTMGLTLVGAGLAAFVAAGAVSARARRQRMRSRPPRSGR